MIGQGTSAFHSGIEQTGGPGNDTIDGTEDDDTLSGAGGDDSLRGGDGWDDLYGNDGNDTLAGGDGYDHYSGGSGDDVFVDEDWDTDGGDYARGGDGIDTIVSPRTTDLWYQGTDVENLTLSGGADIAGYGNPLANLILGNVGDNLLFGDRGNDTLNGGMGDDSIAGEAGKDLLTGSGGLDRMGYFALSDSGATFATRDAINTFAHGDKIELQRLDAVHDRSGNQAFTFSTAPALTGVAGQLVVQQVAANAFLVLADVNGDANADFSLNVYTAPGFGSFHAWDFIL